MITFVLYDLDENLGYQDNTLIKMFLKLGYKVSVITRSWTPSASKDYEGLDVYVVESIFNFRHTWYLSIDLVSILISLNPNIIISIDGMLDAFAIRKYVKNYAAKWYVKCHIDHSNTRYSPIVTKILYLLTRTPIYRLCDSCITRYLYVTPETKKFMMEVYKVKSEKLQFFPLVSAFNREWGITQFGNDTQVITNPSEQLHIFTGGKLTRKKNISMLMKAVSELPNLVTLTITGEYDKSDPNYKLECERISQDTQNIFVYTWASQAALKKHILDADIGIFLGSQSTLWQDCIALEVPIFITTDTEKYSQDPSYLSVNGACTIIDYKEINLEKIKKYILYLASHKSVILEMKADCRILNSTILSPNLLMKSIGL